MLAWMNREALARTVATGEAHYWSRSRKALWRRARSRATCRRCVEVRMDCDADASCCSVERGGHRLPHRPAALLLPAARGREAATRAGVETDPVHRRTPESRSRWLSDDMLERLEAAIAARRGAEPSTSYVASLNAKGQDAILKKVGEEATETVIAAKGGDALHRSCTRPRTCGSTAW